MKITYKILIALFLLLVGYIIYESNQVYNYPDTQELNLKINYLSKVINEPFSPQSVLISIKKQSNEFLLFTLAYSSYAMTNISMLDSTFKPKAINLIDSAIQKALTEIVYNNYFIDINPFKTEIDINGSVLYLGHINLMMGCYRLLSNNPKYDTLNDRISLSLFNRFKNVEYHCLPSYSVSIWIPDNTVALASLKIHSQNTSSKYDSICSVWVKYAKSHFTDTNSGLLASTIDYYNGSITEEPRGCMIGWSIYFIYRFDKTYAKQLYENYKNKFSSNLFYLRLFNERMNDYSIDMGDIDSGPILFGLSIPANAFAFGDAVAFQDLRTAKQIKNFISIGSKQSEENAMIKYETRFVNLNYSPLSEALLLYFETMTDWKK